MQIDWRTALGGNVERGLLRDGDRTVRLLPTDPIELKDVMDEHGTGSWPAPAGASCTGRGMGGHRKALPGDRETRAVRAEYGLHLPPMFRDEKGGDYIGDRCSRRRRGSSISTTPTVSAGS